MNEERKTVYIPTWMDTSIPGLRDPYEPKKYPSMAVYYLDNDERLKRTIAKQCAGSPWE